jgi:large subunit ribosomal protein L3
MRQLLGTKIGMTRLFDDAGNQIPVTVVAAGPCLIVRVKTRETDGYDAVVLGYGTKRKNLYRKPHLGLFAKTGLEPVRHLREMRLPKPEELNVGDIWTVEVFRPGEKVRVTGTSKGKGFQGGMKRHGFSGAQKTHGQSDRWRAPGSIGQSSYPSRVFKGQRMAGHMGNQRVTTRNMKIVEIDPEKNLLMLKGAVPGPRNGLVIIKN